MYDLIIIGAGAAGLFAAANSPVRTLLLEKMDKPGKKMLISGGGMCNLTNGDDTEDFIQVFGSKQKANFLKPALMGLSTEKTKEWFESKGIALKQREDGKVFPQTEKASTIVNALVDSLRRRDVHFKNNSSVVSIEKKENSFLVNTRDQSYIGKNLLITTGGKSFENTGSDGSGYMLAKSLGHKIIEPTQALVPLFIDDYPFKTLAGNSIRNCLVDFFRRGEDKRYLQAKGDLLFTHKGVSGPVILNNSRLIQKGDVLKISLMESENREILRERIISELDKMASKSLRNSLKTLGIFTALTDILLKTLEIGSEEKWNRLNKKKKKELILSLCQYSLQVSRKGYFSSAMVTAGGVSIDEINRKTMESRLVPGLFFAGEVLDLDGNTGGYNIQAAFSTAFASLSAIEKRVNQVLQ